MRWPRLVAYITGRADKELLVRNEYLVAENRILRAKIKAGCNYQRGEEPEPELAGFVPSSNTFANTFSSFLAYASWPQALVAARIWDEPEEQVEHANPINAISFSFNAHSFVWY